jgi:hypothetical protein
LNEKLGDYGFREKWRDAGLTDGSWKFFLTHYCLASAAAQPFESPEYCRDSELENVIQLAEIFDEELIDHIIQGAIPGLADSLKSKWWAEGHKLFSQTFKPTVRDLLGLAMQPDKMAYTAPWDDKILARLRKGAVRWRESPVWRDGVVRTANNEPDVREILIREGFTEAHLQSDS